MNKMSTAAVLCLSDSQESRGRPCISGISRLYSTVWNTTVQMHCMICQHAARASPACSFWRVLCNGNFAAHS